MRQKSISVAQMKASRLAEPEAKKSQLAIKVSRRERHRDVEVTIAVNYHAGRRDPHPDGLAAR